MSLVNILVATAIVGIVAATLASLFEGMTLVMVRSTMSTEADSLHRTIQGILGQSTLCRNAMRTEAGLRIAFPTVNNETEIPVMQIEQDDAAPPPPIVIARTPTLGNPTPMQVAPGLILQRMFIRGADLNNDGATNDALVTSVDGTSTVVQAQVVLRFQYQGGPVNLTGGNFLDDRVINLTITMNTADRLILGCGLNAQARSAANNCFRGQASPPHQLCPPPGDPAAVTDYLGNECSHIPYVREYDLEGNPICGCTIICRPDPTQPLNVPPPLVPPPPPAVGGTGPAITPTINPGVVPPFLGTAPPPAIGFDPTVPVDPTTISIPNIQGY